MLKKKKKRKSSSNQESFKQRCTGKQGGRKKWSGPRLRLGAGGAGWSRKWEGGNYGRGGGNSSGRWVGPENGATSPVFGFQTMGEGWRSGVATNALKGKSTEPDTGLFGVGRPDLKKRVGRKLNPS